MSDGGPCADDELDYMRRKRDQAWDLAGLASVDGKLCTGNDRSPPCGCDKCRTERAYGADAPF